MFFNRLCQALNEAKVKYAVVGGYAVALHGVVRATVNVDLVVALNLKSFEQVEKVFKSLNLTPRLPVTAKEVFQFRKEYIEKRNMIAWSFVNHKSPGEVVDIIINEDLSRMSIQNFHYGSLKIPVLSKKDLIAMKLRSGRPKDIADAEALNEKDNENDKKKAKGKAKISKTEETLHFLENFRLLMAGSSSETTLISLKVPQSLLTTFRRLCEAKGLRYQTQIKSLMLKWIQQETQSKS